MKRPLRPIAKPAKAPAVSFIDSICAVYRTQICDDPDRHRHQPGDRRPPGVLHPPIRSSNAYRLYGSDAVTLVRFVSEAKKPRFRIAEIEQVIEASQYEPPCNLIPATSNATSHN